jgi:hypothetical protein
LTFLDSVSDNKTEYWITGKNYFEDKTEGKHNADANTDGGNNSENSNCELSLIDNSDIKSELHDSFEAKLDLQDNVDIKTEDDQVHSEVQNSFEGNTNLETHNIQIMSENSKLPEVPKNEPVSQITTENHTNIKESRTSKQKSEPKTEFNTNNLEFKHEGNNEEILPSKETLNNKDECGLNLERKTELTDRCQICGAMFEGKIFLIRHLYDTHI